MAQYRYYGHGSHMSADLKRTIARVRAAKPGMFVPQLIRETRMDGEGKVTTTERLEPKAIAPTPFRRHMMSVRERS